MAKAMLQGQRVGMLTALEKVQADNGAVWRFRCDCGGGLTQKVSQVNRKHKRSGIVSCGCVTMRTRIFGDKVKCSRCAKHKPVSEFNKLLGAYQSWCKSCQRVWRNENSAYLKAAKARYHVANRERLNRAASERQAGNKNQSNARSKRWREKNPERRKMVANAWVKRNPEYSTERQRLRAAKSKKARPAWADKAKIRAIYTEAKLRRQAGEDCHVDHIVPLISNLVSGLHCEFNLRVISAKENQKKSNRTWPDMP